MIEAYPLHWPVDYPRQARKKISRFKTTLGAARDFVKDELRRLGASDPVISTNIPLKNDGDLRADWQRYKLEDTGVAVYFIRNGNQVCLCCDKFEKVHDNLHAVGRTIEALRQIDRDGVSDFLNRSFSGFKALPEQSSFDQNLIWPTLGLAGKPDDVQQVHAAYRKQSKEVHPDMPSGDEVSFNRLTEAYKQALKQFS